MATHDEMAANRRERALLFAQMIRDGFTVRAIAGLQGISAQRVYQVMHAACPGFVEPRQYLSSPEPEARPLWSYPDAATLALVRQIRQEMEQAGRPLWSYPDAATLAVVRQIRQEMEQAGKP